LIHLAALQAGASHAQPLPETRGRSARLRVSAVVKLSSDEFDAASIPSKQNPNAPNFLGLVDPWVVAQYRLAAQMFGLDQQAEVYKQIVRHVTEQLDFLPMLINADITLVKPTLCNFKKWPTYGAYVWNIADWYLAGGTTCP
jgi:ABC-type transport system substrate-binding protein